MGGRGSSYNKNASKNFIDFTESSISSDDFFGVKDGDNAKWIESLNKKQKESLVGYTVEDYRSINKYLRGESEGNDSIKEKIKNIQNAISSSPLKSGIVVHRYDNGGFLGIKSIYDIDQKKIGEVIESKGFLSTSTKRTIGFGYIGYDIKLPKGFNQGQFIKKLSFYESENEFLINHKQKFKITGFSKDNYGTTIVQLEYIK